MYYQHFGLTKPPFSNTPDPDFLFESKQHSEALAILFYGVMARKGFMCLTGEVGTGKTLVLECLRRALATRPVTFASLMHSSVTPEEFFALCAQDFGLECFEKPKIQILLELHRYLIRQASEKRVTCLIIDEAQNLEPRVLEEIRLLGNLETPTHGKLLQVVLAGQPEFDQMLDSFGLRQLRQRIELRWRLTPFTPQETSKYIDSRLGRAGLPDQQLIPDVVKDAIYEQSKGIPRLVNVLCDNLLLSVFSSGEERASVERLSEVCRDLFPALRLEAPQNTDGAIGSPGAA